MYADVDIIIARTRSTHLLMDIRQRLQERRGFVAPALRTVRRRISPVRRRRLEPYYLPLSLLGDYNLAILLVTLGYPPTIYCSPYLHPAAAF